MRGYAPTAVPADGAYHLGALVADAVALHEVLGGDGNAVLIGHDWGAEAAYGAAASAPNRWRRLVTLAVPPAALDEVLFSDYEQLKRSFYLFMFTDPAGFAEAVAARDGCIGADLVRGAERLLPPSSRMIVIDYAGHFLHLEEPGQVNDHILSWVS
jgi:pimeloyl-ACP methyl ester carboxylesterase